jgi:hypothetical protein
LLVCSRMSAVDLLALVQECQLTDVVTYFQDAGADLTQGDLLALQRVDCIEYFGKLKGPLYFNRVCKLREKLQQQEDSAAAPEPAPAPRPAPAPVHRPTPAPAAAAAADDWGFGSAPAQQDAGFGGGFGGGGFGGGLEVKAAPVQQPGIYGGRAAKEHNRVNPCYTFRDTGQCVHCACRHPRGEPCLQSVAFCICVHMMACVSWLRTRR